MDELRRRLSEVEREKQVLLDENNKLKQLLHNYNESRKNYYEKNKEVVKERAKQGLKKLAEENPEKLKEYRKRAYLKRKEKLKGATGELANDSIEGQAEDSAAGNI
jgi:hypothetical protein